MEIVKAINGVLQHRTSHTSHYLTDESVVPAPIIGSNSGTLYMPIYTEKGPTNVLRKFSGTGAYAELIKTYGEPDVKRLGLPYTMAALHVAMGGNLVAQSVKHSSATKAGFILGLSIENKNEDNTDITKTLGWILPDGSGFVEDPTAGQEDSLQPTSAHTVHKVNTKRIKLVSIPVTGIKNMDTLVRTASKMYEDILLKPTTERQRVYPILYGLYNGEGEYGNNFQFIMSDSHDTIEGRPYFVGEFYDTRTTSFVPGTKKPFSLSKDSRGDLQLNVNLKFKGDYEVRSMDSFQLDKIGEILQGEFDKVSVFNTTNNMSVEGKLYMENVKEAKDLFKEADKTTTRFNRLSYLNLATLEQLASVFVTEKSTTFKFSGGTEGLLTEMKLKGFDWDFTANVAPVGQPEKRKKVVTEMFKEAFLGMRSAEIYNLWANRADYILDAGFPNEVKIAMVAFVTNNRDDIQCLLNAPIGISSIDEAIEWKKSNDYYSRLITYFPGNFEYLDNDSSESVRVPQTFTMIPMLIDHYREKGFSEPICGVANGMITNVIPGSGRAIGDLTLKSNDKLVNAGFVCVSAYADERVFLDSQKSNYLLNQSSMLQFFHNNSITNRIIKVIYEELESERHRLTSDEAIKRIEDKIQLALKPYQTKVDNLEYKIYFKSDYDKAIGLLSHDINIQYHGEVIYHMVHLTAKPVAAA